MGKHEAKQIAEQFVMKHKESFKSVTEQEIRTAVNKVARALATMTAPQRKIST